MLGCREANIPTSQHPNIPTLLLLLFLTACVTVPAGPPREPNDREWSLLTTDYAWIENLRKAQAPLPANASRKQMIETTLANLEKIRPTLEAFMNKATE